MPDGGKQDPTTVGREFEKVLAFVRCCERTRPETVTVKQHEKEL